MAHVQKFTSGSAGRILGHCEREKSDYGDFLKYRTNSDIDTTKTHMNMSMSFHDGLTPHQRLHKRLNEVHVLKRKDVNVMCDWVITLPKELSQDLDTIKPFFNSSTKFLMNRYGKENVVSCNVHMDEAQPHMHFCFVPVVFDTKKDYYKVSAKEVLTRHDLNTFHTDLENYLHETIGLEKGLIHSGVTKKQGGNKTIGQLKVEKLDQAVQKVSDEIQTFENTLNNKINDIKDSNDWKELEFKVYELNYYHIPISRWFADKPDIKIKKDKITMPLKELDFVFKAAFTLQAQRTAYNVLKSLRDEIRALYDYDPETIEKRYDEVLEKERETNRLYEKQITLNEKFEENEQRINELWYENNNLKQENNKLKDIRKDYEFLNQIYDNLLVKSKEQSHMITSLKNQNNHYEDMFDRFPDLADQIKELYKKQIQHEKLEQQKNLQKEEQKKHKKEHEMIR